MHFGLFGGVRTKRGLGLADGHGYRSFLMVEHHFTRRGQVSASMTPLAYLAAKTRTIRLGTADEIVARTARLRAGGVENIVLADPKANIASPRAFAAEVMPSFQAAMPVRVAAE